MPAAHDPDPARAKLVANERSKVTATFLNGLGTAAVAVGVFGPLAAYLYGPPVSSASPAALIAFAAAWLTGGLSLHLGARAVLRSLQP